MTFEIKFDGQESKHFSLPSLMRHLLVCLQMGMLYKGEEVTIRRVS